MSDVVMVLDKFDLVKEPTSDTNYYQFLDLMYDTSKLNNDICIYLWSDRKNIKNVSFTLYYGDRWVGSNYVEDVVEVFTDRDADSRRNSRTSTIDILRRLMIEITEEYIYLTELSKNYSECVLPSNYKKFVTDKLRTTRFNVSEEKKIQNRIKTNIANKLFLKLNYKLYYIIMDAWEKFWMVILGFVIVTFVVVAVRFILSDKHTIRYELGANNKIEKIVDNANDETVLDVTNMQPTQIIAIIDSLNATLEKRPIIKK